MSDTSIKIWNTCSYARLSPEDGDKEESNSVTGQKNLIRDYLCRHPELRECGMKVDDGYTGSNFNCPDFERWATMFPVCSRSSTSGLSP